MRIIDICIRSRVAVLFIAPICIGCGVSFENRQPGDPSNVLAGANPAPATPAGTPGTPSNRNFKVAMISARFDHGNFGTVLWHSRDNSWQPVAGSAASSVPALSENGLYLTFLTFNGPGVVRLDGSSPSFPVTYNPTHTYSPSLSPDGRKLFFASDDQIGIRGNIRGMGIWVLDSNGMLDEMMERDSRSSLLLNDYLLLGVSHDGSKMAYYRIHRFTGDTTIQQANTDGTGESFIARSRAGYKLMQFNYSHDGNHIAMLECLASDPVPTHCNLLSYDLRTGTTTWLTNSLSEVASPVFSLDDREIFYLSGVNAEVQKIMRMPAEGGASSVLINDINGGLASGPAGGNSISISVD